MIPICHSNLKGLWLSLYLRAVSGQNCSFDTFSWYAFQLRNPYWQRLETYEVASADIALKVSRFYLIKVTYLCSRLQYYYFTLLKSQPPILNQFIVIWFINKNKLTKFILQL